MSKNNAMLHIDCSQEEGIVMISYHNSKKPKIVTLSPKTIAGELNVAIQSALDKAKIGFKDLAAVSVVNGPGSYTGLRIALTTAKAICFASELPLILHHRLSLLSTQYTDPDGATATVVLKAREGEYFVAKDGQVAPQHTDLKGLQDIFFEQVQDGYIVTDSNLFLGQFSFMGTPVTLNTTHWKDQAWSAYDQQDFADIATAEPFYLKSAFISTPKNNILHKN